MCGPLLAPLSTCSPNRSRMRASSPSTSLLNCRDAELPISLPVDLQRNVRQSFAFWPDTQPTAAQMVDFAGQTLHLLLILAGQKLHLLFTPAGQRLLLLLTPAAFIVFCHYNLYIPARVASVCMLDA